MNIQRRLARLQELAQADADGREDAHHELLNEIRVLQRTVETPIETASRINFQVSRLVMIGPWSGGY